MIPILRNGQANRRTYTALHVATLVAAVTISVVAFLFRAQLSQLGSYGYLGIFVISLVGNATLLLPLPSPLAAFVGGSMFNPLVVAMVAAAGATIGESTGYLAGMAGRAVIDDRDTYERLEAYTQRYGVWALFVLALVPNPLFDLAGIAAGVLRLPVWHFLGVTWAGKFVKFLAIAYVGAGSIALFG